MQKLRLSSQHNERCRLMNGTGRNEQIRPGSLAVTATLALRKATNSVMVPIPGGSDYPPIRLYL